MKYESEVTSFLKEVKDKEVKDEVIALYNYLNRTFAGELAFAERDFALGLTNEAGKREILIRSYTKENQLRSFLGLEPLPVIDLSII